MLSSFSRTRCSLSRSACSARRSAVTSRNTSTTPRVTPPRPRIGAALSAMETCLPSRVIERDVVCEIGHRAELEHLPDGILGRHAGLLADDPEHLADRPARCLRLRPAGELLGDTIQRRDAPLGVGGDDRVTDALQRDGEPLTLHGQGILHAPSIEALEQLPAPVALDQRELVVPDDIGHLGGPAALQRVRAEGEHAVLAENSIDGRLVVGEAPPVRLLEPERVAAQPQPGAATCHRVVELGDPPLQHPVLVEAPSEQVPLGVRDDLDPATLTIRLEIRHRLRERAPRLFHVQRRRGDPHAELVRLEAGLEVRHEDVGEVVLRRVELAEVRAPGRVADHVDACPPHA